MKTTIQIKTTFGKLLFEFEKEDNSIKATLLEAIKSSANLYGADLSSANLRSANLYGADLRSADLRKLYGQFSILPEGDLIIWKKLQNNLIAQLLIPSEAKRVNAFGSRKCRFEFVKTIAIWDGKKKVKKGIGSHDGKTVYTVGELTYPDEFDPSPLIECSHGIHGFITKQEAITY